jgi:hypothetical protein
MLSCQRGWGLLQLDAYVITATYFCGTIFGALWMSALECGLIGRCSFHLCPLCCGGDRRRRSVELQDLGKLDYLGCCEDALFFVQ